MFMNDREIIPKSIYEACAPIKNATEFLSGMRDCKEDIPHKMGMGEEYTRGYAAQYQSEQNRIMYK